VDARDVAQWQHAAPELRFFAADGATGFDSSVQPSISISETTDARRWL